MVNGDFDVSDSEALDVMIIAPHPDDAELGMGGGIVKLINCGLRVGILDLTDGEPTPFGSPEVRRQETERASRILGVTWRRNLGLPNRRLEASLDARAMLAGVIRLHRPKWLFAPYWVDAHPDHVAAVQLVEAARFWAKLTKTDLPGVPFHPERIYHYYCIHLKAHPTPSFVLDISQEWELKRQSVEAYQSQFVVGRETTNPSFMDRMRDEAAWWGKSIGVAYGEPYTCREPIGLINFQGLI
ncbi:MAG TPA: bacillithiol biosynthesis deacetylase BshB1 [Pirellulaceae bacterium]|nr:bacillithiol biosynthesis deacetylase BshB1 [Pirellulaceae bacterium]